MHSEEESLRWAAFLRPLLSRNALPLALVEDAREWVGYVMAVGAARAAATQHVSRETTDRAKPAKPQAVSEWLTAGDVASRAGVSAVWVRRWCHGQADCFQDTLGHWQIPRPAADRFFDRHERRKP